MDTLPIAIQQAFKQYPTTIEDRFDTQEQRKRDRVFWHNVLAPVLAFPKGSSQRNAAIVALAKVDHTSHNGAIFRVSERTIRRKLSAYDAAGLHGLGRSKRSDANSKRVAVSREWDSAVPTLPTERLRIAKALRDYVRGLHKGRVAEAPLQALASAKLRELTIMAGFDPGQSALEAICRVPLNLIREERTYRRVGQFKKDRKAYEDARPRIKRSRIGYLPMDVIVGDVHPLDIVMLREDGTTAHPRLIAWLDIATNRLFADIVLLDKGRGIRNADVIQSFINMTRAWGAPRAVYLDNGSEYNWADFIDDALKLLVGAGRPVEIYSDQGRTSQIIRATPYNASAKPIEGIFKLLENQFFSVIPGWVGGDRMNQKRERIGKPATPFPGDVTALNEVLRGMLATYEVIPQQGTLKGISPRQAFNQAIADGWGRTDIDPMALMIAFSALDTRTVTKGGFSFRGEDWTCDALDSYLSRQITIRVPKYHTWDCIPVFDMSGQYLGLARPQRAYGFLDPAGAREANVRQRKHLLAVQHLDRSAPDIDAMEELIAFGRSRPPALEAPIVGSIGASNEARQLGDAMREKAAEIIDFPTGWSLSTNAEERLRSRMERKQRGGAT